MGRSGIGWICSTRRGELIAQAANSWGRLQLVLCLRHSADLVPSRFTSGNTTDDEKLGSVARPMRLGGISRYARELLAGSKGIW